MVLYIYIWLTCQWKTFICTRLIDKLIFNVGWFLFFALFFFRFSFFMCIFYELLHNVSDFVCSILPGNIIMTRLFQKRDLELSTSMPESNLRDRFSFTLDIFQHHNFIVSATFQICKIIKVFFFNKRNISDSKILKLIRVSPLSVWTFKIFLSGLLIGIKA